MGIAYSINDGEETERVLTAGRPNFDRCDNKIITAKYTALSFLPMVRGNKYALDEHYDDRMQ